MHKAAEAAQNETNSSSATDLYAAVSIAFFSRLIKILNRLIRIFSRLFQIVLLTFSFTSWNLYKKKAYANRKDGSSARKAARKRLVSELSGRSVGVRCCPLRA